MRSTQLDWRRIVLRRETSDGLLELAVKVALQETRDLLRAVGFARIGPHAKLGPHSYGDGRPLLNVAARDG